MAQAKKTKKAAVTKQPRCAATTAAGTKCKRPASGKSKFCSAHKTAASRKGPVEKTTKKAAAKKAPKKTSKKK